MNDPFGGSGASFGGAGINVEDIFRMFSGAGGSSSKPFCFKFFLNC